MNKYRILSLDAGGPWALLQIMALRAVYGPERQGHDILKQFQLVAASGGGCITLAGLVANKRVGAILEEFFLNARRRADIFAPPKWIGSKYSASGKLDALKGVLAKAGERRMSALPGFIQGNGGRSPDILICAYDSDRKRAEFFRSLLNSRSASSTAASVDPLFAEVIHVSTTSPLSPIDAPATLGDTQFWDGTGAGLYNPILAAMTEAFANGQKPSDIQVLSIGTGMAQLPKWNRRTDRRLAQEKTKLADVSKSIAKSTFNDPPDSATFIAHVMLGQDPQERIGSVVRMCPVVRPAGNPEVGNWTPPPEFTADEFHRLARLDKIAVDQGMIDLVHRYGELWLKDKVGNQPIRVNSRFNCEVGHENFSGARAAWLALAGGTPLARAEPAMASAPRGGPPVAA